MTIVRCALAATLLGFAINASADLSDLPSGDYVLDKSHGYISYTYDHQGYSTPHVGFNSFDASLTLDSANPENSSIEVVIDATSIDSRVEVFNGHLNGPNFFDTANYPEITFTSTSIRRHHSKTTSTSPGTKATSCSSPSPRTAVTPSPRSPSRV